MSRLNPHAKRHASLGILCGLAMLSAGPVSAQSRVVRVEEHWELKLAQPDSDLSAPQTTMVLSPDGDLEGVHFQFTLNHVTVPQYQPGGMQVQLWDGDQLIEESAAHEAGTLRYADETIHWVQRVSLENDSLTFEVRICRKPSRVVDPDQVGVGHGKRRGSRIKCPHCGGYKSRSVATA